MTDEEIEVMSEIISCLLMIAKNTDYGAEERLRAIRMLETRFDIDSENYPHNTAEEVDDQ